MKTLAKLFAFFKRNFAVAASYKLSFFMGLIGMFVGLSILFFISKILKSAGSEYLASYGGDYFSFLLVGIAFSRYFNGAHRSLAGSVRGEQTGGTLEAMLLTPTNFKSLIACMYLLNIIFAMINIAGLILIGKVFFGVSLVNLNIGLSLFVLFVSTVVFSGLGLISCGFIILFKKGDPLAWLLGTASMLLSGVYFPIEVLPGGLKFLSKLLPMTYSLRLLRKTITTGADWASSINDIRILFIFAAVFFASGVLFLIFAVKKSKREGTLTHF